MQTPPAAWAKKFSYTTNGVQLEEIEVEKDVGVLITTDLKPSKQCSAAAGKANGVLGQISRGVKYRDKKTFIQLYKVYVRPHLEYRHGLHTTRQTRSS